MPIYPVVNAKSCGAAHAAGSIGYHALVGSTFQINVEARCQTLIKDSYTLADLYVRIIGNATIANSTVRSRINGANGNQIVTIGAGATGVFQDAVNSDALVSGNLANSEVTTGAGGSLWVSIIAFTLTTASNTTPILGATEPYGSQVTFATTVWGAIIGYHDYTSTEAIAKYRFRTAATLSNYCVYIMNNTLNNNSIFRVRVNGANGNQVLTVGAGATGRFEDAVNTDGVIAANDVNHQVDTTASTAGNLLSTVVQLKSNSDGQQLAETSVNSLFFLFPNTTTHWSVQGPIGFESPPEGDCQLAAQTALNDSHSYVYCSSNTLDAATTIMTRKNGANGNLTVTIGAGATGVFEDLVSTDSYIAADLVNFKITTPAGAGMAMLSIAGFEINQPRGGIADKSANMGGKMVGIGLV